MSLTLVVVTVLPLGIGIWLYLSFYDWLCGIGEACVTS